MDLGELSLLCTMSMHYEWRLLRCHLVHCYFYMPASLLVRERWLCDPSFKCSLYTGSSSKKAVPLLRDPPHPTPIYFRTEFKNLYRCLIWKLKIRPVLTILETFGLSLLRGDLTPLFISWLVCWPKSAAEACSAALFSIKWSRKMYARATKAIIALFIVWEQYNNFSVSPLDTSWSYLSVVLSKG